MKWISAHPAIVFSLAIVLAMRVWLAIWGAIIIQSHIQSYPFPLAPNPPYLYWGLARAADEGWGLAIAPWQRWDAIWYLRIAEFGYAPDDMSTSFFPLYPILTRALAGVVGEYWVAALVVVTAAAFGVFVLIYKITAELFDEASARRAVVYWAVFPTSFFFFAPYGEAVLTLGALAAMFFARKKEWGRSCIGAAGATLARPIGFLIALPLAIEAWLAGNSWRERAGALLPLAAIPVALGAWMLYLLIRFGDPLLWVHSQENWQRIFVWPGQMVIWTLQKIQAQDSIIQNLNDLGMTYVVLAAVLVSLRKMPLSFSLYAIAMIIVPLLSYSNDPGFAHTPMTAAGRRAIVVFPAFIALGATLKGKLIAPLWVGLSAAMQVYVFRIFVHWLWLD